MQIYYKLNRLSEYRNVAEQWLRLSSMYHHYIIISVKMLISETLSLTLIVNYLVKFAELGIQDNSKNDQLKER